MYKLITILVLCVLHTVLSEIQGVVSYDEYEDQGNAGPLSTACMHCMCKTLNCQRTTYCTRGSCGPYGISYGYWRDAFQKGENEDKEFETCNLSPWCATQTIQAHMRRYLPECAEERRKTSTCEVAMAIHYYGVNECSKELPADTKKVLYDCLDDYTMNWLTSGPTP